MYNKAAYETYTESVIDQIASDTITIQFAGVNLELVSALEIHTDATDDGIEYLITDIESGDEYGVIRTDMTASQMQTCIDATNQMYAEHMADLLVSDADRAVAEYNCWF